MAGILLLLAALGYLKLLNSLNSFALGVGVFIIIRELVRQAMPAYRRPEPEETIITLLAGLFAICIGARALSNFRVKSIYPQVLPQSARRTQRH